MSGHVRGKWVSEGAHCRNSFSFNFSVLSARGDPSATLACAGAKPLDDVAKELQFLNSKKWFFYPEKNQVSIGIPKENLMDIFLKQKDGSVYFLLYDTPIVLKMEKL
jgi:hypothetical protein